MSKTKQALELLAKNPKMTPYEAAKKIGISSPALYRAIRAKNRPRCTHCGGLINTPV